MKISTTTNCFEFVRCCFYETLADPRNLFEKDYNEMGEFEEEEDFDYNKYCNDFIPSVQEWANEVSYELKKYGVKDIKVLSVGHPREYNFYTDWMNVEVEVDDNWRGCMLNNIRYLISDDDCVKYFNEHYKSVSGYVFFGPENWEDFETDVRWKRGNPDILINMYLTLSFIREFGNIADEKWDEITYLMAESLIYYDYGTTKLFIPEGSEDLFKDSKTMEADELYHKVLDKYGWAWRHPKYKSETELCAMLKWAKDNNLTIEELRSI